VNVYPFIEAEKPQQRNIKRACELLEVSGAAYDAIAPLPPRHVSAPTMSSPTTSARPTRPPKAATARPGSTPSCVDAAIGRPGSGWPG
jgi:hypothetical protein